MTLTGNSIQGSRSINTDSNGRYEFRDLPPGRYNLTAFRNGYLRLGYGQKRVGGLFRPILLSEGGLLEKRDFALPRMSVISGRVTDDMQEAVGGASVIAYQMRTTSEGRNLSAAGVASTDASGVFRILSLAPGDYWVQATSSETWTVEVNGQRQANGYSPTYFPGTPRLQDAQAVTVPLGGEVDSVTFSLIPGHAVSIAGQLLDSRGAPLANRSLFLGQEILTSSNGLRGGVINYGKGAIAGADGSFQFNDVATGRYTIQVSVRAEGANAAEGAAVPIEVVDADIAGLLVTTSPGAQIHGIVETDSGKVLPFRPAALHIVARERVPDARPLESNGENGAVDGSGKFTIRNVFGAARIRPTGLPSGWFLGHVYVGDREITDTFLEPAELRDSVRVVVTDKATSVTGSVTDQQGNPVDDYVVVIFAVNDKLWGGDSRFVRVVRADQERRFAINNMPPSDYYIAALDDIEEDELLDSGFLLDLRNHAVTLSLGEAEKKTQTLTLHAR